MSEIIEVILLIVAVFGHSTLCFYAGYRYKQIMEEDNDG